MSQERRRRAWWKRVLRALGFALVALGVLLGAAIAWFESASGQETLRRRVEARLGERVNGSVKLDKLEIHLFGPLELGGLVIADASGKPAISLNQLRIEPAWNELVHGRIVIDRVSLNGLALTVVEDADGGSNLKRLFKPEPAREPPKEQKARRIQVEAISLSGIGVSLTKPDGSTLVVHDAGLDATLDAVPVEKTVELAVTRIGASLERTTPEGAKLSLEKLATRLDVHLEKGAGKIALGAVSGHVSVERPKTAPFATDIALGGIDLDVAPNELGGTLEKLELGLALLDSLELHAERDGEALAGSQRAVIAGLHVDAAKLNQLLGKDLVATNLDLGLKLGGEPNALALGSKLTTKGGALALDGTIDASRLDAPGYALTLVGTALASKKLLLGDKAPDVEVDKISLKLDGRGIKQDEIASDVRLELGPTRIGRIHIDDALVRGRFEHGVFTLHELTVHALGQTLSASGKFVVADKDLALSLELDGDVGRALATLAAAGLPIKSALPIGAVRMEKGDLALELHGKLDQGLTLELPASKLRVAGGRVTLDGSVTLTKGPPDAEGKQKLGLDTLDTQVHLSGVRLSSLAALRGKTLPGLDGRVNGTIALTGTKRDPHAKIALDVEAGRTDSRDAPRLVAEVRGKGGKHALDLELGVYETTPGGARERVAKLDASLPLSLEGKPGLSRGGKMNVELDVPHRTLGELLELLPPEIRSRVHLPPETELEAHVAVEGRTDAPSGSFHVAARTRAVPLSKAHQKLTLDGTIAPKGLRSEIDAKLAAWLDESSAPTARLDAHAALGSSPLLPGAARELDWTLHADVGPQKLESLPLPEEKKRGLSGLASVLVDLAGTRHDAGGKVVVALDDVHKGELGPIAAKLGVFVEPERTRVELDTKAAGLEALRVRGDVGVAGHGLLDAAREKRLGDPSLNLDLDVPRRPLADWQKLRPKLAHFVGQLGGQIHVGGSVEAPLVRGGLALDDFRFADDEPGRIAFELVADTEKVGADVSVGSPNRAPAVVLGASAPREALLGFLRTKQGDASVDLELHARADRRPLRSVIPALTRDFPKIDASGELDWHMAGKLALASHDGARRLDDASLDGELAIEKGVIPIPKSSRKLEDVELRLVATHDGLRIARVHLAESDLEKSDRSLDLHGVLGWSKLRPEHLDLTLESKDFLIFGGESFGKPDAPRAALSAKLDVSGDLTKPRRRVDVTVHALDLRMAERFEKAHWPETASLGDVIYLDETKVAVGKLPVPESKKLAEAPAPPTEPAPPPDPTAPGAQGTDLFVHIPNPIHAQKQPFTFVAKGELEVQLRPGQKKPKIRGEVDVLDGGMGLGGRMHRIIAQSKKSRIYFDAAHPAGELDLWVAYTPNPAALRDISKVSAGGDDSRIHLTGPIGKPFSTVNGVGNADLWDMLPVYNAGRVKFTSRPDMPPSETAQVPREYDVVLLSYMALNLPHNLFLSRINAWANPDDDRFAYGRIRHLEAERYSPNGNTRLRVTERPPAIGASEAEVEADYLWVNGPRVKSGAGVVAGSRAGGGPELFFEWSSDD